MRAAPRVTLPPLDPEAVRRLRGMFLEVAGARLSVAEAARLAGLECTMCQQILEALTDTGFLKRGRDGTFLRRQSDTVDA